MTVDVLLVVGPGALPHRWLDQAREALAGCNTPDAGLDLLMFRDDPDGSLASQVRSLWQGQLDALSGAHYLSQIDEAVRVSVSEFVAGLRERLTEIASAASGQRWGHRFGSLWWKTRISEKNSPADDMWWELFRVAALRHRLKEREYARCVVVGGEWFVHLAEQVLQQAGIQCDAITTNHQPLSLPRVALTRALEGLSFLTAITLSKWYGRSAKVSSQARSADESSPLALLYSLFPRVWTDRFGEWKDMYYGHLPQALGRQLGSEPLFALRMYDSSEFATPGAYMRKLKLLDDPKRSPGRYVLVESFGSIWRTIATYLNPLDALRYFKMTRHPDFDGAFEWEGLDVGRLLKDRMLRSALVSWPHLLALQNSFRRLGRRLRPDLTVMYHFEFMDGRAIIEGLRQGAPQSKVVGMQHGPITPMKMLYSGTPDERHRTPSGSPPMPEPDLYAVDGVWPAAVLERRGIPRSRISVPGAVRFDDVWDESRRLQRARRVGGMVRVLVAPGLHDTAFVVGLALTALKGDPRVELVLKPHPRVSPQSVARWIGPEGGSDSGLSGQARVTLVKSGSIYEWMAQCDIFLATYSSTAVEALAFGIPVILLVPDHSPDMSMYKGHHAPVLRASNAREIREHIDRLASDSTATAEYIARISPALEDCFGPTDCQAAQRLAELCIQLAAERAPQPVPKSDAVRQVV